MCLEEIDDGLNFLPLLNNGYFEAVFRHQMCTNVNNFVVGVVGTENGEIYFSSALSFQLDSSSMLLVFYFCLFYQTKEIVIAIELFDDFFNFFVA
jgi:hypothetical protein